MKRERFLFIATMIAIVAAVSISALAAGLWWRDQAAECQRAVDTRLDARAMFEYLLGEADDPDDPRIVAFRAELDRRIPQLVCVNNKPTPLEEP